MDQPLASKTAAPPMTTAVTVVVPVYGRGPHLEQVIAALQRQSPPVERIIVSHSGEGDPTGRLAGRGVEVLHSDARLYAGAARNRGLELATTDWVAFIDEDVIVDEGWHGALQAAIRRGEEAACVVGSLGYAESGGYWGMSLWFTEFSSVHPYLPRRLIASGPSANMVVRRQALSSLGGFPEDWETAEELVAQARLRELGYAIRFEPDMIGRHVNLPGLWRMLRHGYVRGQGSGLLRHIHTNLTGASAVRWPVLSLGLWLARLVQIYGRVLRAPSGPLFPLVLYTPGIFLAVLAWNLGFSVGAFGRPRDQRRPEAPGT